MEMSGDFLHKRLTFGLPPPTRKKVFGCAHNDDGRRWCPCEWTVFAGGGRCVCLFPAVLGGGCRREVRDSALWSFLSSKRCALQTIRPVVSRKNVVFPLSSGRAALGRRLAFHLFQRQDALFRLSSAAFVPVPRSMLPNGAFFVPEGRAACVACPEGNGYSDGMLRTFNPAAASRPLYDHS